MEPINTTGWPTYQCHKVVRALKIETLHKNTATNIWTATLEGSPCVQLSDDFIQKHSPEIGGWLVAYADHYLSYSPAKAFEEGYKLIDGEEKDSSEAPADEATGMDRGRTSEAQDPRVGPERAD